MKTQFFVGLFIGGILGAALYKWYIEKDSEPIYDFDTKYENTTTEEMREILNDRNDHPQDSDEDDFDNYDAEKQKNYVDGKAMTDDYYANQDLPPRIMTVDEVANLPSSVQNEVIYYYVNDTLLAFESNNEIIDNEPYLLGDCLREYVENDVQTIFVMNYRLNILYEVTKVYDEYEA